MRGGRGRTWVVGVGLGFIIGIIGSGSGSAKLGRGLRRNRRGS